MHTQGLRHTTHRSARQIDRQHCRITLLRHFVGVMLIVIATTGCESQQSTEPTGSAEVQLGSTPPSVGPCDLTVTLLDASGSPLQGADLTVEGNMNHAGMKPSFAEMSETDEPGVYSGTIDFTMGGDWFLLINATGPDGVSIESKIDVLGVETN
ncbi:FixH family protein [Roseiconus lacunae]|uniref:FixH family protein n=1 Tax=Roseiconus lacunae TaxID=2605694 RepID=UPI001E47129F|nr:FixH family protein [Roseiconus lacunae]MCD0460088.1 FixH family protein [Roseiconus lacunae]